MAALGASSSYLSSLSDSLLSQSPPPPPSSPTAVLPPYPKQHYHHSSRSFFNMGSVDLRNQIPFQTASTSNVSLDPNPGSSFGETLRTWNDAHVARWLTDMKCGIHAPTFRANDIRGDLLLELDQPTLQEMNIASIGDRIRILNGVKLLRQRAADKTPFPVRSSRPGETHTRSQSESLRSDQVNGPSRGHPRKESTRPPPLILPPNASKGDNLPVLVDGSAPDSARALPVQPVRPLPVPNRSTPSATQLSTPHRTNLPPPPPPPPQPIPPPPPGAQRPPAYSQAVPSNQLLQTPTNGASWDPSRSKVPIRSTSPLQPSRVRGPVPKVTSPNSGRNGRIVNHPYSGIQSTLQAPSSAQAHNLSPIEEAFANTQLSSATSTPSPPSQPLHNPRPTYSSYNNTPPSLDDIRKKIVKFVIPDEGTSYKIDVTDCSSGQEVIEKVLKKIGKGSRNLDNDGYSERNEDGYLSVDGWAVYTDFSDDPPSEPLSESQLLIICNAPDHPVRERGLTVRKLRRFDERSSSPRSRHQPAQTPKATKRASSISILSGLGVRNPEVALSDPPSPSTDAVGGSSAAHPPAWPGTGKRPSKLRNFFGQRPPSELITSHLGEYFPSAEPKVLRTARHSMALARQSTLYSKKRQSTASTAGHNLNSRFSVSTQGSNTRSISPRPSFSSSPPPPLPTKHLDGEPIPRMSLSTEDGRSVDLHSEDEDSTAGPNAPQLLPPIPLEDNSFSESMEEITTGRPVSKRLSFMSELRNKRDRSDTASMMTVDEVTAEIENRRASKIRDPDSEGWTSVNTEPAVPGDEGDDEGTLATEEEDLEDDLDEDDLSDDEFDLAIPTRTTNKWIKGRLIGAGSFGQVYLGMDASSGLLMAVKQVELPKGNGPNHERKKSMLSALEREIELLKVLQHENIVQYLYSSLDDEYLNIFLEYVPGGSVATLLQNYGAFEETLVRNFVRQILRGLNYLHERDIIHRDIKGANILVDNKGGVKISDFGISKKADNNLLLGGTRNRPSLQGSVFWMAPEVVKQTGHTKTADIWSVGCLVVEMLTGEHPWAQLTQMQAIFKIGSSAKPTIPTDISPEAQDFLQKTFEINHELRPSAAELLQHPWLSRRAKKAQNAANAAAAAAATNETAS